MRRAVAGFWSRTLVQMEHERAAHDQAETPLPLAMVQAAKIVADQIRLDYRLDPPAELPDVEPVAEVPAADPLESIRLANTDAA